MSTESESEVLNQENQDNDQEDGLPDHMQHRLERYTQKISSAIEELWDEDGGDFTAAAFLLEATIINLTALIKSLPDDVQERFVERVIDVVKNV